MEENSKVISLNIQDIMAILPHRPPFLLVDRVVATDCDTYVEAVKNVTMNEPFFVGHFPGQPVMPGVLIMESLAQAAAIVVLTNPRFKGLIPYFLTMDKVKFRKPVQPGDQLHLRIDIISMRSTMGKCKAVASVDGQKVAEGELAFAVVMNKEEKENKE